MSNLRSGGNGYCGKFWSKNLYISVDNFKIMDLKICIKRCHGRGKKLLEPMKDLITTFTLKMGVIPMDNVNTAETDSKGDAVYSEIENDLKEAIPASIIEIISKLKQNPLWMEIGRVLIETRMDEIIGKFELTDRLKGYIKDNQVSYEQFDKEIKELTEEGYLRIEKHSLPDFYLSLRFAKAIEIASMLQKEVGYIPF